MPQTKNPAPLAGGNRARFCVRDAAEFSEPAELQGFGGPNAGPIAVIRKNSAEEIRVELSEFNGHRLVNLRVWADPRNGAGDRIPTKAASPAALRFFLN